VTLQYGAVRKFFLLSGLLLSLGAALDAGTPRPPAFRVLVVTSSPSDHYHSPMIEASRAMWDALAREGRFALDLSRDAAVLSDDSLARYDVVVQLDLAPFDMSADQQAALQRFVESGKGWVGIHAAGLTGDQFLDKKNPGPYWKWFETLMGGVVYSPHPPLQKGTVAVEDRTHPITRHLPARFAIPDEWYEFDRSPRPNVHVLAKADESTYTPRKPMGDHPIAWTNPEFERAAYIGIGHDASVCTDKNFRTLVLNAVLWAGAPKRAAAPRFRGLVLAEKDSAHHKAFVEAATPWLQRLARRDGFAFDFVRDTQTITAESLARYRLFVQLDYPPYAWTPSAAAAFQDYIEKGRGGWVGFHHASLLGEFDGYPMWGWFSKFLGGIRWKDYIATFAAATVNVEDASHPVMAGVPKSFAVAREEWYTYDRSPRPDVHVIASVDESSYRPDSAIKMGDHPVVWSNPGVPARNVYVFMGHGPELLENDAYTTLVRNAIRWAARE
jgi:type 1 glutamine amidotransferase